MSVIYTFFLNCKGMIALMEDKRITRTKKILKETLIQLLAASPFESISIKELCNAAGISRVTFYTHYSDKFHLVDDIFSDMEEKANAEFLRLQAENNPGLDPVNGYCNLLDCILTIYMDHYDFFRHTNPSANPYLAFSFYTTVLKAVEQHTEHAARSLVPKYSVRKITSFLCYGLCGFVTESRAAKCSFETISQESKDILRGIFRSNLLTERP
jgi:AcrR family transcriptional regulator